ncbi:glycosyltransferase family 4 protein [bacterium]|nr:glycosyltransferase family 4 protein [bacterium]
MSNDVFFWQNMPAHIQIGAINEFASIWDGRVTGVFCNDISDDRQRLGWKFNESKHLNTEILPESKWAERARQLVDENQDAIHILSGIGAYAPIDVAAKELGKLKSPKIALIVEPAKNHGWKRHFRLAKGIYYYRPYLTKIQAVLAMGDQGKQHYRRIGFKPEQVFPYIYQCPTPGISTEKPPCKKVRFAFVGQLIERKGIDLLIEAFSQIEEKDWSLSIYGGGPMEQLIRQRIKAMHLQSKIDLRGVISSEQVINELSNHDICCVPSRWDGWGVVTNEAFHAGIPSIVSSTASSSDLVRHSGVGKVFRSENVQDLISQIRYYLRNPASIQIEKSKAIQYSQNITPFAVATYLQDLLLSIFESNGPVPSAPWESV